MATSHDCKYIEVSAALDHNVDALLVGIVKQIRMKMQMEARSSRSTSHARCKPSPEFNFNIKNIHISGEGPQVSEFEQS